MSYRHVTGARHVFGSRVVAKLRKRLAILGESRLGFVTQAHQCFLAAAGASAPEYVVDLRGRHRPGVGIRGILSKSAIATPVAAQIGDRKKYFSGIRNRPAFAAIAQRSG